MFIELTPYKNTNRVRVNVNNIAFYRFIKVDTVRMENQDGFFDVYKTGVYLIGDPVPIVVEEETIVLDKMIAELLSSNQ
jgi:hypothetical protein